MEQTSTVLPDQIIIDEILIRLPVRNLCQFKVVSKLWNVIISSYQFAKAHLNYHEELDSNSKWVFVQHNQHSWLLDYESYDHQHPINNEKHDSTPRKGIISLGKVHDHAFDLPFGSSCGLVSFLGHDGQVIFICNPTLRQCREISTPLGDSFQVHNLVMYGFGYVSSLDDFKLILGTNNGKLYIFSLKNNNWRVISLSLTTTSFHVKEGVLVNNERLHWYKKYGNIFTFDLFNDVFEDIPLPTMPTANLSSGISTMGGCLCLSTYDGHMMRLWRLKQDYGTTNNSWEELYHFHAPPVLEYRHENFFGFSKNREFLMCCWGNCFESFILVEPYKYMPNHKPFEGVNLLLPGFRYLEGFGGDDGNYVVNYVESLVSPHGLAIV